MMNKTTNSLFPELDGPVTPIDSALIAKLAVVMTTDFSAIAGKRFSLLLPHSKYPLVIDGIPESFFKLHGRNRLGTTPAGITYLGQMISHDIVPPTNPPTSFHRTNISPYLQLDSIYGSEEFRKKYKIIDKNGKFKLGHAAGSNKNGKDDLFRVTAANSSSYSFPIGQAIIPEPRNDENRIISQLHLFWQKLHNRIIDEIPFGLFRSSSRKFDIARALVILLFQRVVVDDFLSRILPPHIYQLYCIEDRNYLIETDNGFQIPQEFSHAAFRFGHSMIRNSYTLNKKSRLVPVVDLFVRPPGSQMKKEHIIDWGFFYGTDAQGFRNIDTTITMGMSRIPGTRPQLENIVSLNLDASKDMPMGEEILIHLQNEYLDLMDDARLTTFRQDPLDYEPVDITKDGKLKYFDTELAGKLPLWLYLLMESNQQQSGARLGTLGGIITAEVIMHSIRHANISIYKDWGVIKGVLGKEGTAIYSELLHKFRTIHMWDLITHYK